MIVSNPTGCSCSVDKETELGEATSVTVVTPEEEPYLSPEPELVVGDPNIRSIGTSHDTQWRRQRIREFVGEPDLLTPEQIESLHMFLGDHHEAFLLEDGERGETDLITMEIETGDA